MFYQLSIVQEVCLILILVVVAYAFGKYRESKAWRRVAKNITWQAPASEQTIVRGKKEFVVMEQNYYLGLFNERRGA